jgi:hypothetical protein
MAVIYLDHKEKIVGAWTDILDSILWSEARDDSLQSSKLLKPVSQ